MMKQLDTIEVLAPAGGEDSLKAAVFAGADAVYLGGPAFGARASAKNFTRESLARAVEFCHQRDVRVHVTVNTLLKDKELPEALDFVKFLCTLPVDAVLVQDMGLFSLLRQQAPDLSLHASTQMSIHTPDGALLLERLGAERVVLSREMSLEEIRKVREKTTVELEAFVHGALCMCVSGQCYFSAMLGGRSGNRGMCAQPCRLPFAAQGGTGYDLSLKDLSFLTQIEKLKEAGVCSAKIEGRMKRPEYVAAAVSACRKSADGEGVPSQLLQQLEAVFSRSGFTDGYLTGKRGASMFGIRRKEDVTGATEKVFSALRNYYKAERQKVPVSFVLTRQGDTVSLTVSDEEGNRKTALRQGEENGLLSGKRCEEQLQKTGGTPFLPISVSVPEEGVPLPVSGLNAMRREVLEQLQAVHGKAAPYTFTDMPYPEEKAERRKGELLLRAAFHKASQVPEEAKNCSVIYLPLSTDVEDLLRLKQQGFPPIYLELPRAMFGIEPVVEELVKQRMEQGFTHFVCGNLGAVETVRKLGGVVHGSFSLNITNRAALRFFQQLDLASAELSFELKEREIAGISGDIPKGLMLYGHQPLMLVRNCPLANSPAGCRNCTKPGMLTDRKKKKFPVLCTKTGHFRCIQVYNSVPLWLGDQLEQLSTVDFGIARFTVENPVECGRILHSLKTGKTPDFAYTRGLFRRGVE